MRRVVITGMGTVNPIGNSVEELKESLRNGTSGVAKITQFDTEGFKATLACEVKFEGLDELIGKKEARRMDRFTKLAVAACEEAVKDANLMDAYDPFDVSIYVTSGIGGLTTMEENMKKYMEKGPGRVSPFFIPMNILNMAAGEISMRYKAMGISFAPVSACASGTHSIGEGFRAIKHGYTKAAIVGGSEGSITPMAVAGFSNMKALNETTDVLKASIPFDKDRAGFVMGEGAGALILEDLEEALKRGATIYGEVVGYGATTDAYHMTQPHPEALGAYMAMKKALEEASIDPSEVSYINAHGTSTPMNDRLESMAVMNLFGDKTPVSSTKSMTGHLLGAAGAVESIISIIAIQEGFIPATVNTKEIDEEVKANVIIGKNLKKDLQYVLSNSLGFGGHNASLLFKKWEGK
ncbi:beta-ketoacyl-ACP synthase II [Proteiniclasticum ruminis]|uniref:3-oxoacyl-[acyl-carrier-protein] synthase 2 n=1 Tax=Proteiniclasticum ruminis TaxID=398199 RepID=A0A1G8NRM4_9CLOT|nr:beta-ketoacyl-ACP synthase II [Proteiniclasticum ruminis]SDI82825.1 3-oxoacyl-[acyl-carrier-protein] synthase II [Proteiniclasticum ruminis]